MNNIISEQSRCISHEIRNHLSICELYTQIIKRNLEKENIENSSISNAINCITKSLKIMNNSLLDLKSLDNFSPARYDLKTLIEQGVELSTVYTQEKNIKISCTINNKATVFVDENKFLACIVNLIKNAIEAIEIKGEINIKVDTNENLARISISNNGAMIPDEMQSRIFNEGFTTKQTGSGLGLFICANNLKAQDAHLNLVKSTSDMTEFEITLPVISA